MPGDFDLVKERVDIVQLVGERVALRKAGRAYKGLCPFHPEKTPSFTVDPERRTYKCFGCLPPGSLIKTAKGPRPIEIIGAGDVVYAGDGLLHPVLGTPAHMFRGSLVKLTCAPFKVPLFLTPDHRVPVLRPKSRRREQVEAGDIRPQNYLLYPAVRRAAKDLDWTALPAWFGTRGKRPKPPPQTVDVLLFAEWLGWYLAEGSISNDRSVRFSLGGHESGTAERLRELTGHLFDERLRGGREGSRIELWFCHAPLARWLKHNCGDGAHDKRLPQFTWGWSPREQWALLEALVHGDGRLNSGGYVSRFGYWANPSWSLRLASPGLIDDVRDLLISNGIVPSLTQHRASDGRMSWAVTVAADAQRQWGTGERPPWQPIPIRVRQVEYVPYEGPVYNLTVEHEHTYVTMSATVCNCGEGGDVFTWLEKMDGLEPGEALRALAERAGIELSRRPPEEREGLMRLLAANETAHFYFRQALRGTGAGKAAAAYVAGRGIAEATVERFGVGYAPELRDGLVAYLRKKGFTDDEAVAAGLVLPTERGPIDRFRDRLMFPIRDARGRVIAFGGRAMRADQPGKYVNSPQTPLFSKSATLYALDLAKAAIRRRSEAVIVEGYFDAIAAHQAGLDNVVASMGTALTEEQYRALDDLHIERAIVAFDADEAGGRSAEARGRELARIVQRAARRAGRGAVSARTGVAVYVAQLPQGDPDEMARADPAGLRAVVAAAKPVLEFVIERVALRFDLRSPDARRRFLAETLPLLADEPDALVRELYLGTLSRLTGVPQETLRQQAAAPAPAGPGRAGGPVPVPEPEQRPSLERYVMAQLLAFPEEAARTGLIANDFADPDLRAMFELLASGKRPASDFPAHLAAMSAALGALAPEPAPEADAGPAIEIAALRLREQNLRRRLGETRAALVRTEGADAGGLEDEVAGLARELDELMKARERRTVLRADELEGDR